MRGLRLGIILLVGLAVFLNETPLDARGSPPRDFSTSQTLRAWDGRGLVIPGPSAPVEESRAALKKLGGTRFVLKVDTEHLRKSMLVSAQDDLRRVMRDTRAGYKALIIQDGHVKIQLRNEEDVPRALAGIAGFPAQSGRGLSGSVEVQNLGAGLIALKLVEAEFDERVGASIAQAVEIFSMRFKELGLENPSVKQINPDHIEILLPGLTELRPRFYHLFSHAHLSFRVTEGALLKAGAKYDPSSAFEAIQSSNTKQAFLVRKQIAAHGQDINTATALLDPHSRKPVVAFKLSARGAQQLAKVTQEDAGRALAVVFGHELFAVPQIRDVITDGKAKIQGNFTIQDALELARILRIGMLAAPLTLVEEEVVPPAKP